ncbi:hypothetical protein OHC33_010274 [Knufia fluminis]|uniref:Uncharacterized protein n=1 Tax=Knufia fluminis TaxID=191047 RepID=A0AAN8EYY1_9EURO|nr:hypothetical protein OHC33_010274 [Knufia fluminis]
MPRFRGRGGRGGHPHPHPGRPSGPPPTHPHEPRPHTPYRGRGGTTRGRGGHSHHSNPENTHHTTDPNSTRQGPPRPPRGGGHHDGPRRPHTPHPNNPRGPHRGRDPHHPPRTPRPPPQRTPAQPQTPYNPDDDLNDNPTPPPSPLSPTAPPPHTPTPIPTLLQRHQDHAANHPWLTRRHPSQSPARWFLCPRCARNTDHEAAHVISNPWLFSTLSEIPAEQGGADATWDGEHVWGVGTASLPLQMKITDQRGAAWSCDYLRLKEALYIPSHGHEIQSLDGVNTVCLKRLEKDGAAFFVYPWSRTVFVEFEGGSVSVQGVQREMRTVGGDGGRVEMWELLLCRRGDTQQGHVCGKGREENRWVETEGRYVYRGAQRTPSVGGETNRGRERYQNQYQEYQYDPYQYGYRHGHHSRGRSRSVHWEDDYGSRSRSRSKSRPKYKGRGYRR